MLKTKIETVSRSRSVGAFLSVLFSYSENSKLSLFCLHSCELHVFAKFNRYREKSSVFVFISDEENSEIVNTEQTVVSNFQLPKAEWNRGNPQIIIRNANKSYGSGTMVLDKFTMTVRQGSM